MVELLHRYSKQEKLLRDLSSLLNAPSVQQRLPLEPKQHQNHLDKSQQLKVVESYRSGNSVYEIARQFLITRTTASAILKRHDIKLRYKVLSLEDIQNAKRLYESGASLQVVADFVKVDPSTIRKVLLGAGLQTRPPGTNQWK
ncbi:MAG: helix-turn-helix domain-containing protein [bacterium]|nr:helix-turn-helix domain-containing protein [bacterium]